MAPVVGRPGGRDNTHHSKDKREPVQQPYDPLVAYETILEQANLNVTIYDCDLIVREASRSAAELAGMTREQMRGSSLRDHLPAEYIANSERVVAGETLEIEARIDADLCPEQPWTHVLMLPLLDAGGGVHGGATIVVDTTEQRRAEQLAEKLALVDPVTELPNRRMLSLVLSRALSGVKAGQRQLALVWLNLDRFKDVNTAFGHEAGDALLRAVGQRLSEAVRAGDTVTRVGGDEFALLLPRINSSQHLARLIKRIGSVFAVPFIIGSESLLLTASIGVAVHPNGGSDADAITAHAQAALRAANELGGNTCEIYQESFTENAVVRLRLVGEIREGIEKGHFVLHFQPQIALGTMRVQAVEALVRWDHPERGLLPAEEFIAFAEETAMIVPLGRHVLERACEHHRGWHDQLEEPPRLAINISAREFQRTDVCKQVSEVAAAAGLAPSALEIEITETAVLANPAHAAETAASLRAVGASIALDDFGTGYSSLTHLRQLPIDRIKIDRSFVVSCLSDRSAAAILIAVTHLAHDLGMEVIAEGVETAEQLEFVRAVGCDAAQGYHLAEPLAPAECSEYLLRAAAGPAM